MEDSEVKKINDDLKNIADMLSIMKETHRADMCEVVGSGSGHRCLYEEGHI